MPEWFDGMVQEWSLIGAAPVSFAIALVVVIIVVWAIVHWFYRRMLLSKDIQIEVLQSRLADYRNVLEGASPREAAYKITQLKGELEAAKLNSSLRASEPFGCSIARRICMSILYCSFRILSVSLWPAPTLRRQITTTSANWRSKNNFCRQ